MHGPGFRSSKNKPYKPHHIQVRRHKNVSKSLLRLRANENSWYPYFVQSKLSMSFIHLRHFKVSTTFSLTTISHPCFVLQDDPWSPFQRILIFTDRLRTRGFTKSHPPWVLRYLIGFI